ncbi:uncharacterized protein PSANT_06660 [Moesziomyces antarcticus]|uniref:Uncharacterized protein n=1 Tax=Pseudozyma antarctica TaxID=84753 RepID=A0A5C3FZJ1_PSEA2|nr:uncharacterized protein PSANT_06660 [Moesziomyces antarcticus]
MQWCHLHANAIFMLKTVVVCMMRCSCSNCRAIIDSSAPHSFRQGTSGVVMQAVARFWGAVLAWSSPARQHAIFTLRRNEVGIVGRASPAATVAPSATAAVAGYKHRNGSTGDERGAGPGTAPTVNAILMLRQILVLDVDEVMFLQQLPLHQQQQYAAQLQARDKQRCDASSGSGGMMRGFGGP